MYGIAKAEQIFGEIGAVLPGNAGKERNAPLRILNRHAHSNNAPGLAKSSHHAKSQYIARGRPLTLGLMDPSRTTQTPIMPRFAQANVPRGRRYRPGRTGLAGYRALDHNQAT